MEVSGHRWVVLRTELAIYSVLMYGQRPEDQVQNSIHNGVDEVDSDEAFIWKHVVELLNSLSNAHGRVSEYERTVQKDSFINERRDVLSFGLRVDPVVCLDVEDAVSSCDESYYNCVDDQLDFDRV